MQSSLATAPVPTALWVDRYLSLLGVERQPPTVDFLRALTRAQVLHVPFENVTSILRRASAGDGQVPPLDRDAELEAWMAGRGGGVCFEVADMLGTLLAALGFESHIVLATVLVSIDGTDYLVDAGNGAPFFAPISLPRSSAPVEVRGAGLAYRFRSLSHQSEQLVQDRGIDGGWEQFCTYDLAPADEGVRQAAYQRHHVRGQSWVVDTLTMIRCTESDVWTLRGSRLTHYTAAGKTSRDVTALDELAHLAAEIFALPNAPLVAAAKAVTVSA